MIIYLKKNHYRACEVAQAADYLPSKGEVLSSNFSTAKKKGHH
jgi:hypothetical protein